MVILQFPPEAHASFSENVVYTVGSLLDFYTAEHTIEDTECGVCMERQARAYVSRSIVSDSDTIIFRINRYDDSSGVQTKCHARIDPDEFLVCGDFLCVLVALVDHAGPTIRSGH